MNQMQVEDVSQNSFMDLFGDYTNEPQNPNLNFQAPQPEAADITGGTPPVPEEPAGPDLTEEAPTETDLNPGEETEVAEQPTVQENPYKAYFQKAIASGKYESVDQEDAEGNVTAFIPSTEEEIDEFFELQLNHKLTKKEEALTESIYASKTAPWQLVLKYSEMVSRPEELIPFLTSVQTIESVESLDPEDLDQAEDIVRYKLQTKGESEEVIESHIEAFKTTGKLVDLAKQYKPAILEQERQKTIQDIENKKQAQIQYSNLLNEIRSSTIDVLEKPIAGKMKLKQEEKSAVYQLIGEPTNKNEGFGIYTLIDKLFETKDFEALRDIALVATNKQNFIKYMSTQSVNQNAATLEKKLRVATEQRSASDPATDPKVPSQIKRANKTFTSFSQVK